MDTLTPTGVRSISPSKMIEPSHNIRGVLFDMNGVLVDSPKWNKDAFNLAITEYGLDPIEDEDYMKNFDRLRTLERLELLADRGLFNLSYSSFVYDTKEIITKKILDERCKPVPRIMAAVAYASELFDGNIAVVTNCDRETTELILTKSNLIDMFKVIITRDDVDGKTKPHPWPYIKAQLDMGLGVNRKTTLAIDDTQKGISSARDAMCRLWRINSFEDLSIESLNTVLNNCRITI